MSNITPEYKPMYEEDVGRKHPLNENNAQKIGANQNYYKDSCDARQAADDAQLAAINAWFARDVRMFADSHASRIVPIAEGDGKRFFSLPFVNVSNLDLVAFSAHPDFNFVMYEGESAVPMDFNTERKGVVLKVGLAGGGLGVEVMKVSNRP